ncbi:hypothetical protein D5687_02735 [Guyparkeria sp. SCN-R1]|uniref:hypothetical protein n=1 Tax=unclassified Guyparkeria TaxID=2626246 RepID=UPI000F64891F|nr:hypothetical protein [Guyparkeria sp. SCN-R1]RRQ24382.1 hypothetical protein D5687_02735 [Guyparkeria sp. SCN-R1]
MSEGYRDWAHPSGGLPEQAPEGLVDIYTAPWLVQRAGDASAPADEGSLAWLMVVAIALLLLAGWWLWRHRGDLRLWWALWQLERQSARVIDAAGERALQDEVIRAIGRWQHGGRAPWRERLAEPWSAWVREIDHARFGRQSVHSRPAPDSWRTAVVERLRAMRRALWRRPTA